MSKSPHTILIVDNDKDDHFFLKTALSEVLPGSTVKSLYDGDEVMNYLNICSTLPNLVFLDLNMLRVSGKKTTELIRNNSRLKKLPIIILSTSKGNAEKTELLNLGANDFFTKPCSISGLVEIVSSVKQHWLAD